MEFLSNISLMLSVSCFFAAPVFAIIFIVRWIMRRKKYQYGIIFAVLCALWIPLFYCGIEIPYWTMTPEERAAYEESRAAEESRREESRLAEESRQAEIANCKHTWDSGEITTPSTCEKDGVRTYTCSKCNTTKTETIKATGHTYTEVERSTDFKEKKATVKSKCSCGETKTDKKDMSVNDMATYLKENCKTYDYKEIARYPDKHKGELTTFTGEVVQVQKSVGEAILLVNITKEGDEYFSYYTDSIYVTYKFTDGLKVLEGDIIVMYGESTGEHTYFSVLGQLITVPSYTAYYAELVE